MIRLENDLERKKMVFFSFLEGVQILQIKNLKIKGPVGAKMAVTLEWHTWHESMSYVNVNFSFCLIAFINRTSFSKVLMNRKYFLSKDKLSPVVDFLDHIVGLVVIVNTSHCDF